MEPRAFAVLCFLAEHGDRVVTTTDELRDSARGTNFVTESALTPASRTRAMEARKAVGDDTRHHSPLTNARSAFGCTHCPPSHRGLGR
jgi:hypothetical protein